MSKLNTDTQSLQSCVSVSVTDLRIGNLVIVDNEKYHPKLKDVVLEITEIYESMDLDFKNSHGIGLKHINQKPYTYYERYSQLIVFIKPIPITEEWLLKFGFTKPKDSEGYLLNGLVFYDGFLSSNQKEKLKYVHQLQNLYHALTGSELQAGNLTEH